MCWRQDLIANAGEDKKKIWFGNPVVVADAAMLSKQNMNELRENGYQFIIGGRIKNENAATKREIIEKVEIIKDQEILPLRGRMDLVNCQLFKFPA